VLLYVDERRSKIFRVRRGDVVGTDKGVLRADDVIGMEWGSEVRLSTGIRAYLLKPTPTDFTMKGFRRVTQVIYPKDSSLMVILSGIGYGSRVLESGIGTGFLTAVLAHIVGDAGHVYAYEVREEFARVAVRNLSMAGLAERVTVKVRDVKRGIDEQDLDAAFLDLPDPWEVLGMLPDSLKPSSPVLVFVPSVNQVIKTLSRLKKGPYVDVRVYESILREYQPIPEALRPQTISVTHTGYIIFARFVRRARDSPT